MDNRAQVCSPVGKRVKTCASGGNCSCKKDTTLVPGTNNTFKGFSIDGNIEINMYLRNDGTIISAFPKFD